MTDQSRDKTPPGPPPAPPIDDVLQNISVNAAISPWPQRLRLAAIATLVIGYAALSHYSASSPNAKGLGAVLSVAPILLIGLILAWRWTRPFTALLIAAAACAILYRYW